MSQTINANRLFYASCFALITTAFSFSIRAGILTQLGAELSLDTVQLGHINQMWFLGFPISMILGGVFYSAIGPKLIMQIALIAHAIGILLTIYAVDYNTLLISTLLIGLGNGCTEAACNPMIADSYSGLDFNSKLNRFHMWFPGGIVIGSLISKFMTDASMPWQAQIWVILIPTAIYAVLFYGQAFPKPRAGAENALDSFKAMLNPLYLFMAACMALTAISEFGPQQWVGPILAKAGASPMLILALVTGLMAVGRYFAGPIIHKLNTVGVLLGSAIFGVIGLYMMSTMDGSMLYVAAVFFALGICYFWPNMLGYVSETMPQTGALGLSILGGIGMFSSSMFQPIIGAWIQENKVAAEATGLAGDAADLAAGQATLSNMLIFPAILIVAFIGLYFFGKKVNHSA
ncbi:MFS transporter [Aquirufa aurantiipilula]|uniref:MFS transporter n=1 Tax=Aquirufa aurantiipilula TaxID=2696561 RepID=A0ABT6BFZ3_9BACT|nr:MFS transporter [Aquirufa aurantiipilula]MBZ1327132.1 MFS transporter [Aquirufa aurantiipilula]MDF5689302.1 MFS transporter [Aquirufa aurantiipilula]